MFRPLIGLLLLLSTAAAAEGPGTRIRSNSQIPQPPQLLRPDAADACARLKGEARERCMENERKPVETGRSSGPGSTGMGSSAGSSSSGGTSGGSFGASAPR